MNIFPFSVAVYNWLTFFSWLTILHIFFKIKIMLLKYLVEFVYLYQKGNYRRIQKYSHTWSICQVQRKTCVLSVQFDLLVSFCSFLLFFLILNTCMCHLGSSFSNDQFCFVENSTTKCIKRQSFVFYFNFLNKFQNITFL